MPFGSKTSYGSGHMSTVASSTKCPRCKKSKYRCKCR